MNTIEFYDPKGDHGYMSNYYPSPFLLHGIVWPTVEHFFQCSKFMHENEPSRAYAVHILQASTPNKARVLGMMKRGGGFKWRTDLNDIIDWGVASGAHIRSNWDHDRVAFMYEGVKAKFTQNESLKKLLLSTGDRFLVEHSKDSFWGDGLGSGTNCLGTILETVRNELSVR